MIFHVAMEKAEDGWIVVECPALPGCVSQGRDEKEAPDNIKEAITAWMWAEDQKAVRNMTPQQTSLVVAVCWENSATSQAEKQRKPLAEQDGSRWGRLGVTWS